MNQIDASLVFAERLWLWFETHKRTLPWRDLDISDDTQRAYMVLVSEIMLQQTQVSRVIIIFKNFLEQFPTIRHLADASNKDVILAWRGMGYNSRALRLRDAARTIVDTYKGEFPGELHELLAIKGIGPYTAAAIRNFAFHLPTPCIDTNIRRILHRVFAGPETVDEEGKEKWELNDRKLLLIADDTLRIALESVPINQEPINPFGKLRTGQSTQNWHSALMDFGSAVCTKSAPKCDICPMAKDGLCTSAFRVQAILKKRKKKESTEPGRLVGSVFIPNRIFRGRIVETLRDSSGGMSLQEIGSIITVDWSFDDHSVWLSGLLVKLEKDEMVKKMGEVFVLAE
ncbi:MAG: hypothetical protein JWM56_1175 [Candidatus Peribacteria bacterium]|nr:hypothetical protein [Candidatus Peribacteria bacterium]